MGLEPTTRPLEEGCSIQLSYASIEIPRKSAEHLVDSKFRLSSLGSFAEKAFCISTGIWSQAPDDLVHRIISFWLKVRIYVPSLPTTTARLWLSPALYGEQFNWGQSSNIRSTPGPEEQEFFRKVKMWVNITLRDSPLSRQFFG